MHAKKISPVTAIIILGALDSSKNFIWEWELGPDCTRRKIITQIRSHRDRDEDNAMRRHGEGERHVNAPPTPNKVKYCTYVALHCGITFAYLIFFVEVSSAQDPPLIPRLAEFRYSPSHIQYPS